LQLCLRFLFERVPKYERGEKQSIGLLDKKREKTTGKNSQTNESTGAEPETWRRKKNNKRERAMADSEMEPK